MEVWHDRIPLRRDMPKKAGFQLLFRPSQTEYGLSLLPSSRRGSHGSRMPKTAGCGGLLRGAHEGLVLSRENATVTKKALKRFTPVDDDAALQAEFELPGRFPPHARVVEKAMAML